MAKATSKKIKAPKIVVIAQDDTEFIESIHGVDHVDDLVKRSGGAIYGVYFFDSNRTVLIKSTRERSGYELEFLRFEPLREPRDIDKRLSLEADLASLADEYIDRLGRSGVLMGKTFIDSHPDDSKIFFAQEKTVPTDEDEYDQLIGEVRDVFESDTDISPLKAIRRAMRQKKPR